MAQRSHTTEERQQALDLAAELGPMEAARRLNIPAGTLKRWRMEAKRAAQPAEATQPAPADEYAEQREKGAQDAWKAAQAALRQVRRLTTQGKAGDAQKAALAFAILVDKSNLLAQTAAAARVQVIEAEQSRPEPLAEVPDDAGRLLEAAAILSEIGALPCPHCGGRQDDRGDDRDDRWDGPPLLPSPRPHPDDREEYDDMIGPRRMVQAVNGRGEPVWRPAEPEPEPEEVVDGEVVVEDEAVRLTEAEIHSDERFWTSST